MSDNYLLRTRVLALPTADSYRRGQFLLLENPGSADDKLYYGIQETAGTYTLKEITLGTITLPVIIVQEEDVTKVASLAALDFAGAAFNITDEGSGEARIAIAFGTGSGTVAEGNHTHDQFGLADDTFTRLFFSDTALSTSDTVNYTTMVTGTFTLPSGTWTIEANGWGRFGHDADGNGQFRIVIDGTNGTGYTRSGSSAGAYPAGAASSKTGVTSGSRTVTIQFRNVTAGNATMSNTHLLVNCYRTA